MWILTKVIFPLLNTIVPLRSANAGAPGRIPYAVFLYPPTNPDFGGTDELLRTGSRSCLRVGKDRQHGALLGCKRQNRVA